MRTWHLAAVLLTALVVAVPPRVVAAEFVVPELSGPVVDAAGMMTAGGRASAARRIQKLWSDGGSQIAVLTVPNLGGLAIEQASIRVVDRWQLGHASKDNGVLLLIARDEREVRIEVGQGLEGSLPDAFARRIIDDVITPQFKQGDIDGGVIRGIQAIIARTDPQFSTAADQSAPVAEPVPGGPLANFRGLIPFIVLAVILLSSRRRGRRRSALLLGGMGGFGRGGGFGGGGGGGFRGGGGGFSGGGASGRW